MHGVNVVYKHAPYIAYPDPGQPWNFDATDAAKMQTPRFQRRASRHRVAGTRAGVGRSRTSRRSARPGAPGDAPEWNQAIAEQYLDHVAGHRRPAGPLRHLHAARHAPGRLQPELPGRGRPRLGRLHGQRADRPQGRPLVEQLLEPDAADRGGPLLEPTTSWGTCRATTTWPGRRWRSTSRTTTWVIGYDPYNEPFSTETQTASDSTFTGQLECFYIGKGARRHSWPTAPAR